MDLQLTGRFAVVTGASKGIGLATARRLVAEGVHVLGVARTATAELKDVADVVVTADLATPDGATAVADAVTTWATDGLDLLVNNAGGIPLGGDDPAHLGGFATIDDDAWRRTLDLNLLSAVRVTRALVDLLLRRGGVIVNVSSIGARIAGPGIDYGVAKAGLTNLTKALSEEYAHADCARSRSARARPELRCGPTRIARPATSPDHSASSWTICWPAFPSRWASASDGSPSRRRPQRPSRSSPPPWPAPSPEPTSSSTAAR